MADYDQLLDSFEQTEQPLKQKSDLLRILLIITYIGCIWQVLGGIWNYLMICNVTGLMGGVAQSGGMFAKSKDIIEAECVNKTGILIIAVAAAILCFIGALWMNKLKKRGFFIYALGEIGGQVGMTCLMGQLTLLCWTGFILPSIFVILYATQLKFMKD